MRKPLQLALVLLCFLVAGFSLDGQTPKKKAPTVQELQAQVIELQGRLMECQNTAKANAPSPVRDALEAFQTFSSTVDTGVNYQAYRDALIPLKVKVDRLPASEALPIYKRTLEMLVDAGQLWNTYILKSSQTVMDGSDVKLMALNFPDAWKKTETEFRGNCFMPNKNTGGTLVGVYCIKLFSENLIQQGQENIKGFPKP